MSDELKRLEELKDNIKKLKERQNNEITSQIKKSGEIIDKIDSPVEVINEEGTSDDKSFEDEDYNSWIDKWKDKTNQKGPVCCSNINHKPPICQPHNQINGAHVKARFASTPIYIIPLCNNCNQSKQIITVKGGTKFMVK